MGLRSHPVINSPQPEKGNSSIEGVEMEALEDGLLCGHQLSYFDNGQCGIHEKEGRVYKALAVLYVRDPEIIGPSLSNHTVYKPHVLKVRMTVFDLQK